MLIKAGIGVVITLALVGTTLQVTMPPRPKVLFNPSSSAPIGWYQVTDNPFPKTHDLIAAYAPEWARRLADERSYLPYDYPLIKSVLAVEGDEVCYHIDRVSVPNGADMLEALNISEMAESQNVENQGDLKGDCRVLGNAR